MSTHSPAHWALFTRSQPLLDSSAATSFTHSHQHSATGMHSPSAPAAQHPRRSRGEGYTSAQQPITQYATPSYPVLE